MVSSCKILRDGISMATGFSQFSVAFRCFDEKNDRHAHSESSIRSTHSSAGSIPGGDRAREAASPPARAFEPAVLMFPSTIPWQPGLASCDGDAWVRLPQVEVGPHDLSRQASKASLEEAQFIAAG